MAEQLFAVGDRVAISQYLVWELRMVWTNGVVISRRDDDDGRSIVVEVCTDAGATEIIEFWFEMDINLYRTRRVGSGFVKVAYPYDPDMDYTS